MRGMGDTRRKLRPTFSETTISVDLLIEATGKVAVTNGHYGKITFLPVSGGTLETYIGIWTKLSTDAPNDNPQMQTLTLECDYDDV